jgi:subtilisin family serine protease
MSWVMQAIEKAALDFKCDIISMSLGSLFDNGGLDPVSKLVNDVVQKYNVLCAVAAGNSWIPLSIGSPAGAISAVTVGSYALRLPAAGIPSSFESKGPTTSLIIKPDTSAPGGNLLAPGIAEMILAAGAHESYQSMAGTSMATPQAAGALALLRQAKPDLSRMEVEQLLAISSFPVPKDTLRGYGPIRVDKMYGNLGKALPPISKLQAPLNVLQSTLYAPLTLIPRPENERLRTVRLPAIMGG